jgi:hypothetical protein
MRTVLLILATLVSVSCVSRRAPETFRVLPAKPEYLLRDPAATETPFPEVLNRFTPLASAWVELRAEMELRVENAYYREGSTRRRLADFLGTQIAHYQVRRNGSLKFLVVESGVKEQPAGQPPVQSLVSASQTRYRYHRFFYEILLNRKSELRGAVLLGASSAAELDRFAAQLFADPLSVCNAGSPQCSVFPETCTASLEIEIVVNGAPRTVLWGSFLAGVVPRPRHVGVLRSYRGRLVPVEIDPSDPNALRLPLLPGDHIQFDGEINPGHDVLKRENPR